ncbi:MAG: hypothetical protein Ct9H90mP22_1090 [Gammaproteobacteria bacterium]|nr:MAG: hypothetical protein Ct9H90mP22_1090 [Gammaproteobacteria bacterium]
MMNGNLRMKRGADYKNLSVKDRVIKCHGFWRLDFEILRTFDY